LQLHRDDVKKGFKTPRNRIIMFWKVKELTDKDEILSFLEIDRLYASYAIGDLETDLFEQTAWFGADSDGQIHSLAMLFRGVKVPVLFLMGNSDGLRAILDHVFSPEPAYINCRSEHRRIVQEIYRWDEPIAVWRMALNRKRFHTVKGTCIRLTTDYADMLEKFYEDGGMPGFTRGQLGQGVFYGILKNGRLIAAGGTHLVSRDYNVAAVGNVFTHPDYRGQGYGAATTGAVSAELVRLGIRDIVLNVGQRNTSAVHIYEKIGFQCYCSFFEGAVSLRKQIKRF
jgi:GNAT superfamily N-acetyltransferase